jgi:hypothetical protein
VIVAPAVAENAKTAKSAHASAARYLVRGMYFPLCLM